MQGDTNPEKLDSDELEQFQMDKDLNKKLAEFIGAQVDIISKTEMVFAFTNNMVKKIIFYSEEPDSYLMLFYFGLGKELAAYATAEPKRPCYFKRLNTMIELIQKNSRSGSQSPTEITLHFKKGIKYE